MEASPNNLEYMVRSDPPDEIMGGRARSPNFSLRRKLTQEKFFSQGVRSERKQVEPNNEDMLENQENEVNEDNNLQFNTPNRDKKQSLLADIKKLSAGEKNEGHISDEELEKSQKVH